MSFNMLDFCDECGQSKEPFVWPGHGQVGWIINHLPDCPLYWLPSSNP